MTRARIRVYYLITVASLAIASWEHDLPWALFMGLGAILMGLGITADGGDEHGT